MSFLHPAQCTASLLCAALCLVQPAPAIAAAAQRSEAKVASASAALWVPCAQDASPDRTLRERARGHARVILDNSTITLEVRTCRLVDVLELISTRTGISITASDELSQRPISTLIEAQPVESALRQLVSATDVFVLYSADGRTQRVAAMWVYPRGGARDIAPVPSQLWASRQEFEAQLTDQDPDVRGRAIEELVARGGESALARVLEALADPDADVRQRALDAALDAELEVPLEQLEHLAINDPSAEVRLRALQTLEQRPDASATIEAAAFDQDPDIRGEAQNMLARLKRPPH